jgi:hypothetical protein
MSSTRRASDGEFHQERFCSAPEFQGDAINGLAAKKRIAIVKDRATREILWWLQWQSLTPGKLQQLRDDLVAVFPDRIGSPTLRKLQRGADRELTEREADAIVRELGVSARLEDWSSYFSRERCDYADKSRTLRISEVSEKVADDLRELPEQLVRFCLDPEADIAKGVRYFEDLIGALTILRARSIAAARARLADTAVTRKINETLDFWYARRRMVLIEGVAGIGRTATTQAWCDAHAGMVRYVEVPSSSDDRSFFASIARELGVARGVSFKGQEIKVRIEEMLSSSELMIVFDESQYLWTQAMHPRKTPDRLLWLKTTFDSGTPIALVAHTDFSKWQDHYVKRTLWTDEQFERRLNRRVTLPTEHSKEDMLKIARVHFPAGNSKSWKQLASYALGTKKKQASGIVEALESARYRAGLADRTEPAFADIEAALMHDHGYLSATPGGVLPLEESASAEALQPSCKTGAKVRPRSAGESDFPILVPPAGERIIAPTVAV